MRFRDTPISEVVVVDLEPHIDERGFFARSYASDAFAERGLLAVPCEVNISHNPEARTLRGMHYQAPPYPDPKLVRCTSGSIFDVALDLRPESPTYLQWFGTILSAASRSALHVPAGCAHGFVTLEASTEVLYLMGETYHAELARGVRWDDPQFSIEWPVQPKVISARDAGFADFIA